MAQYGGIMHYIHKQTPHEVFAWAKERFFAQASEALKQRGSFNVALPGGSTAQGLFALLAHGDREALKKTNWFLSDERAIDLSSTESNAGQAWRSLGEPGLIEQRHFFPMFSSGTAKNAALHYEALIKKHLPSDLDVPQFDIIYLGMGLDGHTASLFPHDPLVISQASNAALIESTEQAYAGFQRITMMPRLIKAAREIVILTTGQEKMSLAEQLIHGPKDPTRWPIQFFTERENSYFLTSS